MRSEMTIQSEMQSLREHDLYQEVAQEERWTVLLDKIIPGKSVFTIKREGTKKVRIVGCGNFQEDIGIAVFTVNVNVITVRVVWMVLDRSRCQNSVSPRISGRSGKCLRETSTFAVPVEFHCKRSFLEAQEGSLWASFISETLGYVETIVRCSCSLDHCVAWR